MTFVADDKRTKKGAGEYRDVCERDGLKARRPDRKMQPRLGEKLGSVFALSRENARIYSGWTIRVREARECESSDMCVCSPPTYLTKLFKAIVASLFLLFRPTLLSPLRAIVEARYLAPISIEIERTVVRLISAFLSEIPR